jgi:hypothetical protein
VGSGAKSGSEKSHPVPSPSDGERVVPQSRDRVRGLHHRLLVFEESAFGRVTFRRLCLCMGWNETMAERETSSANRKCAQCGAELPGNLPDELCPKCLLKAAMGTQPVLGPTGTVGLPTAETKLRGLPQPGEELGHYRIVRLLGRGGMGAAFEAEDLESGRRVALKVLSHTLDSPDARERFFR